MKDLSSVPGIFWTTLLASMAILGVATLLGRCLGGLYPPRQRGPARYYLAPALGMAVLTIFASLMGRILPLGHSILVPILFVILVAGALWRDPHRGAALGQAGIVGIFGLFCGASLLAPLFTFGAFNAHNDAITYLIHANWLQDHAFREAIRAQDVTPFTSQVFMYQQWGLRMGGSYLLALAQALLHGLLQGGLAHCAKHFPGHGHVKADSHTDIPLDRRGLRTLLAADAMPYRQLASSLVAVMPAHVIYPRIDQRPAGFSPVWLQQVLRGQLRFQGAIISDDLSMAGARQVAGQSLSLTGSVLAALNAGCDLALVCNQSLHGGAALDELLDGMEQALASNEFSLNALGAARRVQLLPQTAPLPWDRLMTDPRYMRALDFI